jgi:site-specific DNA-cytosine methylase
MRLLDLFCGRWGWSRAFAARGWSVVGIDLVEPPETPKGCIFRQADVLLDERITPQWIRAHFDFGIASSPCENFSLSQIRNFHPDPPYPDLGIKLFNHTRWLFEEAGIPYLMENVARAQDFVGPS